MKAHILLGMLWGFALLCVSEAQAVQASVSITVMPTITMWNGELAGDTHWTRLFGEGIKGHCTCVPDSSSGACSKLSTDSNDEEAFSHYIRGHYDFYCWGIKVHTVHVE